MPCVEAGAGADPTSGPDTRLAQSEIPMLSANAPAIIARPMRRSRVRCSGGSETVGAGSWCMAEAGATLYHGRAVLEERRAKDDPECPPFSRLPKPSTRARKPSLRAHNSAVECVLHTDEVAGSIPAAPTRNLAGSTFPRSATVHGPHSVAVRHATGSD